MHRFPIHLNAEVLRRRADPTICSVDDDECSGPARCKGYCRRHYERVRRHGDPSVFLMRQSKSPFPRGQMPATCIKEGCNKPTHALGLCKAHYSEHYRWGKSGPPQRFETCPVCRKRQYSIRSGNGMCGQCAKGIVRRTSFITHDQGFWDRDTCKMAGLVWYELTGYAPRSTHWRAIGPRGRFPGTSVVLRLFGCWSSFIHELDLPLPPYPKHTEETCMAAGLSFIDMYGYIPSLNQWYVARMSPSSGPILACFGRWTPFKLALADATGLDPGYMRKAA